MTCVIEKSELKASSLFELLDDDASVDEVYHMETRGKQYDLPKLKSQSLFTVVSEANPTDKLITLPLTVSEAEVPASQDVEIGVSMVTLSSEMEHTTALEALVKQNASKLNQSNMRVIGVGGAGCNAVNYLKQQGLEYVDAVALNSDGQSLSNIMADHKVQLGPDGLGVGGDVEVGRRLAEEQEEQIKALLSGTNMVFLATSMGGGTGTGASPVVAKLATDAKILVIGVVYMPYGFEKKTALANEGLDELKKYTDLLIVIPNDNLEQIDVDDISEQMDCAHEVLLQSVTGIYEVLENHGMINADFNDLKTVCQHRGRGIIGVGEAQGKSEDRADLAVQAAINNPLLDTNEFKSAKSMLINIRGSFGKKDIARVRAILDSYLKDESIKICLMPDASFGDRLQITLIATGIDHDAAMTESIKRKIASESTFAEQEVEVAVLDRVEKKQYQKRRHDQLWLSDEDMPALLKAQLD